MCKYLARDRASIIMLNNMSISLHCWCFKGTKQCLERAAVSISPEKKLEKASDLILRSSSAPDIDQSKIREPTIPSVEEPTRVVSSEIGDFS
jgi:hypothetical protein